MSWLRRTWPYLLVLLAAALAIWFILSWSSSDANAAKPKHAKPGPAFPLHYGSRGVRVKDAQWLMSGHNRWKIRTFRGKLGTFYTLDTAKAACQMKFRLGYKPSYFQDSGQRQLAICRRFGTTLRGYLTGKRLPSAVWRWRLKHRWPAPPKPRPRAKPKPSRAQTIIAKVVDAALFAYRHRYEISYTQGSRRWDQIHFRIFMPPHIAHYSDCSSFVTSLYWQTGLQPDLLNGLQWSAGYTGTLATHGHLVSSSTARPGDLVLYGYSFPFSHVAVVVRGYGGSAYVVSQGSEIGPLFLPMRYRRDLGMVRRYVS